MEAIIKTVPLKNKKWIATMTTGEMTTCTPEHVTERRAWTALKTIIEREMDNEETEPDPELFGTDVPTGV